MTFSLRPCRLPADYATLAAIQAAALDTAADTAAAGLTSRDGWAPPDTISCRIVAEDPAGNAVGFAEAYRFPNTAAGKFYCHVAVMPGARGQGAGAQLLSHVEQFAAAHGGNRFVGDVRDADASSLAFLQKRGYTVERHSFDSVLDLSGFDLTPFAGAVPTAAARGIRFFTLAEAPGTATLQALYDLYGRTMVDIPGYEAQSFMAYETWHKLVVDGDGCRPDWVFIAADGERLAGVTTLIVTGNHVYTNHTLVDPDYRGRGIALALKVLTVEAALRQGAPYMRTGNDAANGPMLAVNRKLGYRPRTGDYTVARHL